MVEALRLRRQLGYGPVTGLCCDNLEKNGVVLHRAVTKLAEQIDPDLAEWISENCSFPCSMVDCIVPSTGAYELELVQAYSLNDNVPVTHENFRQWVIEDDFCAGRPDLEKVVLSSQKSSLLRNNENKIAEWWPSNNRKCWRIVIISHYIRLHARHQNCISFC